MNMISVRNLLGMAHNVKNCFKAEVWFSWTFIWGDSKSFHFFDFQNWMRWYWSRTIETSKVTAISLLINSIILSNIRWNWPIPAGFRQSEYPKIPNRIVHITRVLPICCITETSANSIKDPLQICLLELPTILVPAISHKHKITCRFLTKTLSKLTESSYWLAIFFNRLKRIEPWRNFEHYRISVVCTNCPCLNVFVIWLKTRCIRQQNRLWLRKLRQFATMVSIFPT